MLFRTLISILLTCFVFVCTGQGENTTSGNLKSFKRNEQIFNFTLTNAHVQLEVVTASIIHIRAAQEALDENFSYAVVGKPIATTINVDEQKNELIIRTDSLQVVIKKQPFRISFLTVNGKIINEDEDAFGITWTGHEATAYKKLVDGERFIGLGEKTGNLDRRGNGYTNWNTDCFGYGPDTDPLYSSIPFYMGVHDGLSYGIFLDNSSKTHFNFGASNTRFSSFTIEEDEMDYYFIHHSEIKDIITSYTYLTGRAPLPPKWSMGFQQCRWSYYPDNEVLGIAKTFREKKIPLDVIYLDIHFMDGNKVFTWNKSRFPDPSGMISELRKMGIHTTVIVDPGIKVEKNYAAYEEGLSKDVFLKYPDQTNYEGSVWPGLCHFPDFTKSSTRKWWGNSFEAYTKVGVEGFWNDMNEPATWGQRFPSLVEFDFDGHHSNTLQGRNIYGMQMARSTYQGAKSLMSNQRPFVLTRAAFAGSQRYSALWTGDNTASDEHMLLGVRLVNSLGLSGYANVGVDVGGFNGDASAALYSRWISIGAFTPFFRAHKMINMKESEPWSYGEQTEAIAKYYIQLRYKLMPYLYSSFYEHTQTGVPVARSLAINNTHEPMVYDVRFQHQYLFGKNILVAPTSSEKMLTEVWLPDGIWYDFYNDEKFEGKQEVAVESPLHRLPVFVKGGSIIPMQKTVQSTDESAGDTLSVHVYFSAAASTFEYYEDDGKSYEFESGNFIKRQIRFDGINKRIRFERTSGNYPSVFKELKVVLHGFDVKTATVNGANQMLTSEQSMLLYPTSIYYEELYFAKRDVAEVKTLIIENTIDEIEIGW